MLKHYKELIDNNILIENKIRFIPKEIYASESHSDKLSFVTKINEKQLQDSSFEFVMQINFDEIPPVDNFPDHGLMQIFKSPDNIYKVIYYEYVPLEFLLRKIVTTEAIEFSSGYSYPSCEDYRMNLICGKDIYSTVSTRGKLIPGVLDELNYDEQKQILNLVDNSGIKIGGYPKLIKLDPRHDCKYKRHSTLLLQLETNESLLHLFITEEDLLNRNFNNVLVHFTNM